MIIRRLEILMRNTEFIELNGIPILGLCYHDFPPHNKNLPQKLYHTLKVVFVRQGKGVWLIGNKNYEINPGDFFIFNNNEYRTIRTVYPPENLLLMVIDFEPRFIWSNQQDLFDSSYLKIFFERKSDKFENRIKSDSPVSNMLQNLMLEIECEMLSKHPEYKQMIKVKLLNILVILNRHYCNVLDANHNSSISMQHYTLITKALHYIEENLFEDLSRDSLAKILHINPSGLSKLFKKYNGIGMTEYIIKKRIYKSIELLENSDLSILEIANRCGFNNSANFYKAFKAVTSNVPSHYRKN